MSYNLRENGLSFYKWIEVTIHIYRFKRLYVPKEGMWQLYLSTHITLHILFGLYHRPLLTHVYDRTAG